eukprot:1341443-Pleurochrysis_carterae.AAC.1
MAAAPASPGLGVPVRVLLIALLAPVVIYVRLKAIGTPDADEEPVKAGAAFGGTSRVPVAGENT